jgi:hypothetical protein
MTMEDRVTSMETKLEELQQSMESMKIDSQYYFKAPDPITPGHACKVYFDMNGLITHGEELSASDIPMLGMDRITGLQDQLDRIAGNEKEHALSIDELTKQMGPGAVAMTGTKVNVDEYGKVISVSNLLVEDIPALPIDKIDGLEDVLEELRSRAPAETSTNQSVDTTSVVQKISISMSDLPAELFTRLNELDSRMIGYASQASVDAIAKLLTTKVDGNQSIKAGTFTKVRVGTNGLVTFGDQLSKSDLPALDVDDITDLSRLLQSKADRSELNDIMSALDTLISTSNRLSSVLTLENNLKSKADDADLKNVEIRVSRVQTQLNEMQNSGTDQQLLDELRLIRSDISQLVGRVTVLEQKLNISD